MNNQYMYSSASNAVETKRLAGFNDIINPVTLAVLADYLKPNMRILELGCGSGELAKSVAERAQSCELIAVDKDKAQIDLANEKLKIFENARAIHLDITHDLDKLEGKYDLIYCRWVLVHVPTKLIKKTLGKIISLLSENGIFICEECDNSKVLFSCNREDEALKKDCEKSTESWLEISNKLMKLLGNDFALTPEKITQHFIDAGAAAKQIEHLKTYQIKLKNAEEKDLICKGYRSSSEVLRQIDVDVETIIKPFEHCANDDDVEVDFLVQHFMLCRKSRLI